MNCPDCNSSNTRKNKQLTILGYKRYHCRACNRSYNERTGTEYNNIEYRTEVVVIAIFYYYRFKLSLDDVVILMAMRNIYLSHQTVANWVQRFGVDMGIKMRARRYKTCGDRWHADATYIRVEGRWCYLYRAIDKEGNLIDVYLSDVRNQAAAEAFFKQAAKTCGVYPDIITTDKEPALYPAIESTFGDYTDHRDNKFMNNRIEQDHRAPKSRIDVMKGFKNIFNAQIFCTAFEEIRQFFRMRNKTRSEKRRLFAPRFKDFNQLSVI